VSSRLYLAVTFLGAALFFAGPSIAQPDPGQTLTGKVVTVDGDTYDVRTSGGQTVTVRLHGVDAPESDQPYGSESTAAIREYIGGKTVRVTAKGTGPYGRTIGSVELGGASLAEMLARDGLAWYYERYAPDRSELSRLERQASNASRGLWSQANPIPPWGWRDGVRQQSSSEPMPGLPYAPNGPPGQPISTHRMLHSGSTRPVAGQSLNPHRLDEDGGACEGL